MKHYYLSTSSLSPHVDLPCCTDGLVFLSGGRNVTGEPGQRLELRCEVEANPEAEVSWYRDQKPHKVTS